MSMKITLYVDVVSPFAYIAYHVLRHDPAFKNCEITYTPIFLGGIMKAAGNTPPINIKNKDKWINTERLRWARYFSVPMVAAPPPGFPPSTLAAMRAVCGIAAAATAQQQQQQQQQQQRAVVEALDALFAAYWVQGRAVDEPDVLADVLGEGAADEEAGAAGKTALRENTVRAFAEGAFGLPWMVCENASGQREGFWGVDHLGCVLDFMGIEKPPTGGWRAML